MPDLESTISHIAAAAVGAIPGLGAWWLEFRKGKVESESVAFNELKAVVEVLRSELERQAEEIKALRGETEDAKRHAWRSEDEVRALKEWMRLHNLPLPPPVTPEGHR